MSPLEIVGRSSSHFTRVARVFALELGVPHVFRPVFDLTSRDPRTYAENPALKIPILMTSEGPWFGTANICRELVRRAPTAESVVLLSDVSNRLVANAEELTLQAMMTDVGLIMAKTTNSPTPPKSRQSLEQSLAWLDENVDRVIESLPADRTLSFLEVALFCLVTHLPFREVMDVTAYGRLAAFCDRFGAREGARQTTYRFDAP